MPADLLGTTANSFAVLGGSTVTNTGPTVITGDLGVGPGTAITGFPPGIVLAPGTLHSADAVALQAQAETTTAYNLLAGLPATATLTGQDLGGLTLLPGVYFFASTAQLTGTLTLDGQGDPNARFVFQIGSTLTTASSSSVVFANGAVRQEVYWQVGSSATLGSATEFAGNIVALTSISFGTGANISCGRALARNGAVTLDTNIIVNNCANTPGSISGRKFEDLNGDGVEQPAEPGLSGVTVYLDTNGNSILDAGETSAISGANGLYNFANLPLGTYVVREAQQSGLLQTTADPIPITLTSGQNVTGINFGDFRLVSLSGLKFNDLNGNGIQEATDTGVAGVTIFLDTNFNGTLDGSDVQTMTIADGTFTFTNVGPGTYRIREVTPAGTTQTTPNPADFVTTSGTNVGGILFGNFQPAVPPVIPPVIPPVVPPGVPPVIPPVVPPGVPPVIPPVVPPLVPPGVPPVIPPVVPPGVPPVIPPVVPPGVPPVIPPVVPPGVPPVIPPVVPPLVPPGVPPVIPPLVPPVIPPVIPPGVPPVIPPVIPPVVPPLVPPGIPPVIPPVITALIPGTTLAALPAMTPSTIATPLMGASKRMFLTSTSSITVTATVQTGRMVPDYAALGSVSASRRPTFIATAEGAGGELVRVFDLTTGQERFRFRPFPGNPGGVRVTTADLSGDGIPDIVVGAGPGGAPRVVAYDGNTGAVMFDFLAFEPAFTGGVFIAAGDLDGDGQADLVVTPDTGGGPRVRVLAGGNPEQVLADFWGIADTAFRGGARPAVGDLNADGVADLVIGAGTGGSPRVAAFDGRSIRNAQTPTQLFNDFFAFDDGLRDGVYLAIGDADGDGFGDLFVGAGPGGGPRVVVFAAQTLLSGMPTVSTSFFAGDVADRGGVPIAAVDVDGDGRTEVLTGAGQRSLPRVRFSDPQTGAIRDEFAAEYMEFLGGIQVA